MHAVETKPAIRPLNIRPQRVVLVGDREIKNLSALLNFQEDANSKTLNTVGLIAAGHEATETFFNNIDQLFTGGGYTGFTSDEQTFEICKDIRTDEGILAFTFKSLPYDAKSFKTDSNARENYMLELREHVAALNPDLVLLSNFKLILSKTFVQAFSGKVINIHPSFLPLLKGFRPEHRAANLAEDKEANGYTIHLVSEELDGGPTLFQEQIETAPYNSELETKMGIKEYQKLREEVHRLAIINAQLLKAPLVLELFASSVERIVVNDKAAFAAEGRLVFYHSKKYQAQLHQEHEESKSLVPYKLWYSFSRKPYQRVLFLDQESDQYVTAENYLFGRSQIVSQTEEHSKTPNVTYEFNVPSSKIDLVYGLYDIPRTIGRKITVQYDDDNSMIYVRIVGEVDIDALLTEHKVEFSKELNSVRVTAPRRQLEW